MDVVIPVRPAPHNPQLELALQTWAKHFPEATIWLIGHNPSSLNLHHIPTQQGEDRFTNTETAMRAALNSDRISDPFVWTNDDIYLTRRHNPAHWHQGELPHTVDEAGIPPRYAQRKVEARRTLELHGLPTLDYELHTPTWIHKPVMEQALQIGGTMRTIHGNLLGGGQYHPDVKARPGLPIPDGPFISSARNTFEQVKTHIHRNTP
jgi:hypothetical protein